MMAVKLKDVIDAEKSALLTNFFYDCSVNVSNVSLGKLLKMDQKFNAMISNIK